MKKVVRKKNRAKNTEEMQPYTLVQVTKVCQLKPHKKN